jgi:hypothetical protein
MSGAKFDGMTPWPDKAAARYVARGYVAAFLMETVV